MAELPFLVVHGALVWKASVVGVGVAAVRLARLRRDRKSAKFVRAATKHYTATATGLEPGPILLRGRLRGGGAQSFEHTYCPIVHTRDEGVYFDIEGERIDFDGEIVVGCGTEVRTSYWRPPVGAPPPDGLMATARGQQRLSIVRADEEVLIAGVLRRAASGDATYRDSAGGWLIEPFPRQGAVGLVAMRHRARAMPATPVGTAVTFLLFALLMLLGMRTCGSIELGGYGPSDAHIHSLSVAAAMPGTRGDALGELERVLSDARTPHRIDQAIELRALRHGCASAVDMMFEEHRLEQALDASRRCELPAREVDALLLLGRYDEAAASTAMREAGTAQQRLTLAIATGHWADAAAAEPDHCASLLFAALANPSARAAMQSEVAQTGDVRCSLLAAQLLPAEERGGAVASITTKSDGHVILAEALLQLDRTWDADNLDGAARELLGGDGGEASMLVWTARPGDLTPWRAVFETYRGNFAKAQEIAGTLIAQQHDRVRGIEANRFAALIALRAGKPVPREWLDGDSELPPQSVFTDDELGATFQLARGDGAIGSRGSYGLRSAMNGDGSRLHDEWTELRLADGTKLLAVLPAITTDRDLAIDFMRAVRGDSMDHAQPPLGVIRAAAMRRDLARATGDADGATSWQGVIDRQMAVIDHRDRLLGLIAR